MKQRKLIVALAIVLVLVLSVGVLAACNPDPDDVVDPMKYTVLDSFITSPTTWNPHQSRTTDDTYVSDYTTSGMYEFFFNEDKTGYVIKPVMAASEPVDVTTTLKAEAKWQIPEDATKGYAYTIDLNPNACWDDGTPINADTYVESMKLLLSPELVNYRASGYYTGDMQIFGAKDYNKQDAPIYEDFFKFMNAENETDVAINTANGATVEKNEDGEYLYVVGEDKYPVVVALNESCYFFGATFDFIYTDYGYGDAGYFNDADGNDLFDVLKGMQDKYGNVAVTDEVIEILEVLAVNFGDAIEEGEGDDAVVVARPGAWNEFCNVVVGYGAEYSWDNVGIYKSGEYQITLVFNKSLSGFYLLYNLAGSWIVNVDLYNAGLSQDQFGIWTNSYCTGVQAGTSSGPYKLTTYQEGKLMVFDRNENWFGYDDPRFEGMYQATGIRSVQVAEAGTRKQMFLKGELDAYGLQTEDYAEYRTSDNFYTSPGTTIFFLTLNSDAQALKIAEKPGVDKEIIANDKFREALSLAFDKDAFAATISPSRSGAYSVIGAYDIWNPSTGEKYRDTEIAKTALAEYYGFTKQADGTWKSAGSDVVYTLDEAIEAITGFNPVAAKELFLEAYEEQLAAGLINETDKIEIEYASSSTSAFIVKTLNYLNEQINEIVKGTALENRISIVESAPQGNAWSEALRSGKSQTCLCGWNGGMLNPFGGILYYTYPDYDPYAEEWWNTEDEEMTLSLPVGENGAMVEITMSISDWGLCLNGDAITVGENTYNFGFEQVADEVRLTILAGLEKTILATNYYIPMLQDGSGFLLTHKVNYALGPDDYNAVLGRGGIAYMTFNYTDMEWEAYCKEVGELSY